MQLEPKDLYEKLEFDKIRNLLQNYCLGELGKAAIYKIGPETELILIRGKLEEVKEFKLTLENDDRFPINSYSEITKDLRMLEVVDFVLPEEGLQRINVILLFIRDIFRFFTNTRQEVYPRLYNIIRKVSFDDGLIEAIEKVIDEEGNIKPDASPELLKIRKGIIQCIK